MSKNKFSPRVFKCAALLFCLIFSAAELSAQDTSAKAEAVIKKAVERLGGEKYLQIKSVIATGNYTIYQNQVATMPADFTDIISYPDSERTEFNQLGKKFIQVNTGGTGWIYDTTSKAIREQNAKELRLFRRAMRTNLDNFLRGKWRENGAKLSYVGKREAGIGKRNDVVKVIYSDGFEIEYEFAATDALPAKVIYKNEDFETPDAKFEERFAQFLEIQGVFTPFVIDRFIGGKQESRVNYINISFNRDIPPAAFAKPASVKDMKKSFKF